VLTVAPAATALGVFGGIAVGLVTGYYRGLVDNVVMRLIDAALAFPLIIIAVLVLAVLGRSTVNVVLVIGIVFTPLVSRTVRSAVLVEREREYVAAAKLRGESGFYVMAAEILPNITGPIAVEATIRLGYAIFTSATLSFLGLGLKPPSPDWGLAVASGRAFLQIAPWIVLFPALALATLVVAVNLVADGLKQVVEE
jgi:peptide/nickel transport system permease protein